MRIAGKADAYQPFSVPEHPLQQMTLTETKRRVALVVCDWVERNAACRAANRNRE